MQKSNAKNTDMMGIDLNLLRMLRALLQTGSITQSGELLGLSQPAASRTMTKLRAVFQDPLLVRTSKGYVLTPVAESLRPLVTKALISASEVFNRQAFTPADSHRIFQLGSTDYGVLTCGPSIAQALSSHAPHCVLHINPWHELTLTHLESGDLDLAFYADGDLPNDFHYRRLFSEHYSLIGRHGHPMKHVDVNDFDHWQNQMGQYVHIVSRYPSGRLFEIDDLLKELNVETYHVGLSTPYFATAPYLVASSDMLMIVPHRIARLYQPMLQLEVMDVPKGLLGFEYRMVWHKRAHKDDAVTWLRNVILDMFSHHDQSRI